MTDQTIRRKASPLPFMRFDIGGQAPSQSPQASPGLPSSTPHRARSSSSTPVGGSANAGPTDLLNFGQSEAASSSGQHSSSSSLLPAGHELVLADDFFDVPSAPSSSSDATPSIPVPVDILFAPTPTFTAPPPSLPAPLFSIVGPSACPPSTSPSPADAPLFPLPDAGIAFPVASSEDPVPASIDPFLVFTQQSQSSIPDHRQQSSSSTTTTTHRSGDGESVRLVDVPSVGAPIAAEHELDTDSLPERIGSAIDQVQNFLIQAGDHASVRKTYQDEVRDLIRQIYKYYTEDRIEKGQCACERRLAYKYKFKIIQFDPHTARDVRTALSNLHTFTFGPSALSIAQQQFAELKMIRLILSEYVPSLQSLEPADRLAHIMSLFNRLMSLLANQHSLTAHSVSLIQKLNIYLADLAYAEAPFRRHMAGFVFGKILTYPVDAEWLVPAFSPSAEDVVELRLLDLLAGIANDANTNTNTNINDSEGMVSPDTILLLLQQLPWSDLAPHAAAIQPLLELLLQYAAGHSHRLLAFLIKVFLQLGSSASPLQLLRLPWPIRIFTLPFLYYWPLSPTLSFSSSSPPPPALDQQPSSIIFEQEHHQHQQQEQQQQENAPLNLEQLFLDLYHFFGVTSLSALLEQQQQQRADPLPHRMEVVHFMLFNHQTTQTIYEIEPALGDALAFAGFPLLHCLTRVALLVGAPAVDFLARELFYLAFQMPTSPDYLPLPAPPIPGNVADLLAGLQVEAQLHLQSLAQHSPQVAWNAVFPCVVQCVADGTVSPVSLNSSLFRDRSILAGWRPDSVDFLASLFRLPSIDTNTDPLPDKLAAFLLHSQSHAQGGKSIDRAQCLLGVDIFERVHWELASPEVQANAVILLLSVYHQLHAANNYDLVGLMGRILECLLNSGSVSSATTTTSKPQNCSLLSSLAQSAFGSLLIREAQSLPPAVRSSLAVKMVRLVMLLSVVANTQPVASLGMDWLAQSGIVAELEALVTNASPLNWTVVSYVLSYTVATIASTKFAVEPSCNILSRFLHKICTISNGLADSFLTRTLIRSIRAEPSLPESSPATTATATSNSTASASASAEVSRFSAQNIDVWATILFPHLEGLNRLLCGMWESIAELVFLEGETCQGLLKMFRIRLPTVEFIETLFNNSYYWSAFSALTAFTLGNAKKAVDVWRRLATKLGTAPLALAYWRSFAALYYQLQEKQSEHVLSESQLQELTAHFRHTAENFTEHRDLSQAMTTGPRELYYALTTWAKPALEAQWFAPAFFTLFRKAHTRGVEQHHNFINCLPLTPLDFVRPHSTSTDRVVYDDAVQAAAIRVAALPPPQTLPADVIESLAILLSNLPTDEPGENGELTSATVAETEEELVEQLRKYFQQFKETQLRVEELDYSLLDLYQSLHENRLEEKTVHVKCAGTGRGPCLGAAQIQISLAKQLPASPEVTAALTSNRESHAQLIESMKMNLQKIGRVLFQIHVLAERLSKLDTLKLTTFFVPSFDFFGTQLGGAGTASEAENTAAKGVQFFLALAELCSEVDLLPHSALLLGTTMHELAAPLHNRLSLDSDVQARLLNMIVQHRGRRGLLLSAETYEPLLAAFAPGSLLPQSRPMFTNILTQLCQYLEGFGHEDEDECPLPDQTLSELLRRFDSSDYFDALEEFEIYVALRLLPSLILMEPLYDFAGKVACALLATDRRVSVLRTFLLTSRYVKYPMTLWENNMRGICSLLDFGRTLSLDDIFAIMDSFCSEQGQLTLDNPATAIALLTFVQRLCVPVGDTPQTTTASSSVGAFFDVLASPLPNRGWECFHGFIRRSTAGSKGAGALGEEGFLRLFDLLWELTVMAPQLVDRMWLTACVLLERCVLACTTPGDTSRSSEDVATLTRRCEALAHMVNELPWERAAFHRNTPKMLFMGTRFPPTLQRIFDVVKQTHTSIAATVIGRVNWEGFVCPPDAAVSLLQWYLDWNVIAPDAIPAHLRDIVQPHASVLTELDSTAAVAQHRQNSASSSDDGEAATSSTTTTTEGDGRIDWSRVDPIDLATAINQTPLLRTLRDGRARDDPSRQLLDNATLLRDVAWASGNEMVVVACVREARSLMSVRIAPPSLTSGKTISRRNTWHLSSREQISLLTSVILPLSRFNVSVRVAGQLILSVLDILNSNYPKPEPVADQNSQLAGKNELHPVRDPDFQLKVHGLILQSVQVATAPLCLEIMNTAALVMETTPDQPPLLLFEVFEAALLSYLLRDEARLSVAVSSLQLPALSWELCVQACHERRCSLCLLVMVEKQRRSIDQCEPTSWMSNVLALIETISYHTPPEITEYHLFPLWFFVLRCISDPRFKQYKGQGQELSEPLTSKAVLSFNAHLKTYAQTISALERLFSRQQPIQVSQPSVRMRLAARSVLLFLRRLLAPKGGPSGSALTSELDALMSEKTALLASHSSYAKTFFEEAETFLSPLCDLASFERIIVTTLAPQAQHYLLRLIDLPGDSTPSR